MFPLSGLLPCVTIHTGQTLMFPSDSIEVRVKMEVPKKAAKMKVRMVIYRLLTESLGPSIHPQRPLSTPPQRPCYAPKLSPPPNSPLSSRATSMVSETDSDPEDSFPLTPDSKCSGGAYYHLNTPSKAELWTPSHLTVTIDQKLQTARHMDGLSPKSCRYVVHYKEAVRERQCMRLFMTYWELEETNRLRTLLLSLYAETETEFRRAEHDAQALLNALVTKQSLSRVAEDTQYLDTVRQHNKTSLRETDTQLDLLRDHILQGPPVRSSAGGLDNPSSYILIETLAHPTWTERESTNEPLGVALLTQANDSEDQLIAISPTLARVTLEHRRRDTRSHWHEASSSSESFCCPPSFQ
ncbi:hypothetical protein BD769DRAFT_1394632 [Suillus cothurnatus]|nr:hypothetical protein BD769DRAFT_1394632 [Suillus cothurnatus]